MQTRHVIVSLQLIALGLLAPIGNVVSAQTTNPSWDVTVPRGQTREIDFTTDEGTWMSSDISPDGQWIVFDLLGHVYRVPADGGDAEALTQNSGIALNFHPRYSPDGETIAFVSDRKGQNNLWIMDANGSNPRPIFLDELTRITEPKWLPDGNAIVAVRNFPTYSMHRRSARLWKFPLDGTAPTELVGAPSGVQAYWPSPSPDGAYLYYHFSTFAEPLHGLQRRQHIRRLDLNTGAIGAVTLPEPARFYWGDGPKEMAPEVSPDGRWLAFVRRIPGGAISYREHVFRRRTALWLRNLETGAERILMDPITLDMSMAHGMKNLRIVPGYGWAGDSRSLVLSQGGKLRRVWVDDGRVETIPFRARVHRTISEMARSRHDIDDGPFDVRFFQWPSSSPDGGTVVFTAVGWIWRTETSGGPTTRLTSTSSTAFELMPAFSPDGEWIAFVTWDDEERGHVFKVRARGGAPERISTEPGEYLYPVWSPDGRSIVVTRGGNATARGLSVGSNLSYDLVRLPTEGGSATVVVSPVPMVRAAFDPGGRLFYRVTRGGGDVQVPLSQGRPVPTQTSMLVSVDGDGGDRREHLTFPGATQAGTIVPSPDGQWVAFRDDYDLYLAPFRWTDATYEGGLRWKGRTGPVHIDKDSPTSAVRRISNEGGLHPRWRDATTLEFVSGNRYYTYDVSTGRADTIEIRLKVAQHIPDGSIALTGARIITLDDRRVIDRGTVIVRGGRITCVGSCDPSAADSVIDLSGKTVVPGFTDVHAHHLGGGSPVVPQHRYQSALYLAYGVTTVLDPAPNNELAFPVAELIRAGRIVGPRTYASGNILMPQSPSTGLPDAEETFHAIKRRASWGAISVKHYLHPRRDQPQMIADAARRLGLSVTNEGADLYFNVGMVMDGHTGWEHPMMYVPLYKDAAQFFGQARVVYSPTLAVAGAGYWSEDYFQPRGDLWNDPKQRRFVPWTRLMRSINAAERPIEEYSFPIMAEGLADIVRAGGYGSLGGHGEQIGLDTQWEMRVYGQAMTPMEVLETASLGGAYMMGLEDDLGSIEVGKLADLVVLNANPLEDIEHTADIAFVMKRGILYDGNTLDELWPERRPYGPRPWANDDVYRADVRPVEYWNRR